MGVDSVRDRAWARFRGRSCGLLWCVLGCVVGAPVGGVSVGVVLVFELGDRVRVVESWGGRAVAWSGSREGVVFGRGAFRSTGGDFVEVVFDDEAVHAVDARLLVAGSPRPALLPEPSWGLDEAFAGADDGA